MAQDIGTVYVQVVPSGKDFGRNIEGQISQNVANAGKKGGSGLMSTIGGAFSRIGKIGLGAVGAVTGGIAALAGKGGFDRALNIENAQAKLKGLGHDTADIAAIMDNALASVKGTAFGLGDAATVAASLSAAGVKSGDQMTDVLKTVADTAQISGRSLTDIGTIFGSVAARGKLQGDDMLQLMSSGVPVLQLLGKHLGKTSEEVSDMVSKGRIDFQTFADAMQEGLGGAALAAGDTFSGALANVKAALGRLGETAATPAMDALRRAFVAVTPAIDAAAAQLKPLVEQLVQKFGPEVDRAIRLIDVFAKQLQDGSLTIGDIAGKVGMLVSGLGMLASVGGAPQILDFFSRIGSSADAGIGGLAAKVKELPGRLSDGLGGLEQFGMLFDRDLREALAVDGDPMANAVQRVASGGERLTAPLKAIGARISSTDLGKSISGMAGKASTGFGKLTSLMDSNIRAFATRAGGQLSAAFNGLGDTKIGGMFAKLADKVKSGASGALSGLGDVFGGIGGIIGPKLQAGLGRLGGMVNRLIGPGAIVKLVGFGGIAAALVAGLGMIDSSMNGQVSTMISDFMSRLPGQLLQISQVASTMIPQWVKSGADMINGILVGLTSNLPMILQTGATIITSLLSSLSEQAPQIMQNGVQLVITLVQGLLTNLPMILDAAMQLLNSLGQGLVAAIPMLVAALPQIITSLVTGLIAALPQMLSTAATLITGLARGLVSAIPALIAALPSIIVSIVRGLVTGLPQIVSAGLQLLTALPMGFFQALPAILGAIPQIITSVKNIFTQTDWVSVGKNIIDGIANGIKNFASNLWNSIKDVAGGALDAVKGFLGIHSPSRVFRDQVGRWIPEGMAAGIERNRSVVADSSTAMAAAALRPMMGVPDQFGRIMQDATGKLSADLTPSLTMNAANVRAGAFTQGTAGNDALSVLLEQLNGQVKALHAALPGIISDSTPVMSARDLNRINA